MFRQHLEIPLYVEITSVCCVNMNQMMIATKSSKILRIRWDGTEERDFSLDLKRIPFSINQQVSYGNVVRLKANKRKIIEHLSYSNTQKNVFH